MLLYGHTPITKDNVCLRIRSNLLTHCSSQHSHIIQSVPSSVSFSDSDVDWTFQNRTCLISPTSHRPSSHRHAKLLCWRNQLYCTLTAEAGSISQQHSTSTDQRHRSVWLRTSVRRIHPLWPTSSQRALWTPQCFAMRRRGVCTNLPTFRKTQLPTTFRMVE
jgi:hypothetical protein